MDPNSISIPRLTLLLILTLATCSTGVDDPVLTNTQQTVLAKLALFDRTYSRWVNEQTSVPEIWEYLGHEVFGEYADMDCSGDAQSDAPFLLRGMLASGVSYLYAAQAYREMGPNAAIKFLDCYDRGLDVLETVIQIDEQNPDIGFLPNFTALRFAYAQEPETKHPFFGYETILTGVTHVAQDLLHLKRNLVTNRTLQSDFYQQFRRLDDYQKALNKWYTACDEEARQSAALQFDQGSTVTTARYFLSEFCPWGLGVYRTLKEAGLTTGLDWRILRPFAGDKPLDISEFTIKAPQLPTHMAQELNQVVGDGKAGFLDNAKKHPVQWAWVSQPPTYTIKFVSPLVYERQRLDDQFSSAMGYVKWIFGGPVDYIVDATLGKLLEGVGCYYGRDNDIYHASWVLVHANDKGLLTTGFVAKRELPGIGLVLKKTAGAAFAALEDQLLRDMYEGVDPRTFHLGTGYDGQRIPPIMLRGDMLGFQDVPRDEYGRTIQAVRHYLLRPAAITQKNPTFAYDLSKNQGLGALRKDRYLQEQPQPTPFIFLTSQVAARSSRLSKEVSRMSGR